MSVEQALPITLPITALFVDIAIHLDGGQCWLLHGALRIHSWSVAHTTSFDSDNLEGSFCSNHGECLSALSNVFGGGEEGISIDSNLGEENDCAWNIGSAKERVRVISEKTVHL